jgi:hypothetical protein
MEVAEWVGHRRLRAARMEMPCPRVISLRIAFGPAFRVFLRNPGAKVWTKLRARPAFWADDRRELRSVKSASLNAKLLPASIIDVVQGLDWNLH